MLAIPHARLSADALAAVIEAFVLREGTDYGTESFSLVEKCAQVHAALLRGEVTLCFDGVSESTTLVPTAELPETARLPAALREPRTPRPPKGE